MVDGKLSVALADAQQLMEAYKMFRAAARTVREVGERKAVGCWAGQERNARLVETIRNWHGLLSSTLLQILGIEDTPLYLEIANEVLGLVQAHETDRFGVAAVRGAARNRIANRRAVRDYEDLLKEKCELERKLSQLSVARQLDHVLVASKSRRLAEVDQKGEAALDVLNPILAFALSGGRAILTRDEMGEVLRPGEAMLAFRIGDQFSVASLNIRHGEKLTTLTVPLPRAAFDTVEAAVSAILEPSKRASL